MKKHFLFPCVLLILLTFSLAGAASVTESFNGLSGGGASNITGSSSIAGFTLDYLAGPPNSSIATASPFPGLGDNKYLVVPGSAFDWVQFNGGTIATNANTIQFAFPIRLDLLAAAAANANVDLMTLDTTTGSYTPYFNFRVSQGLLRTTNENGWPGDTSPISNTAFMPGNPGNWLGTGWHILAFRVTPRASNGSYVVYEINPTTGVATLLQNYTGAANPAVQATVNRFCLGLCIGTAAVGDTTTQVSIDNITFWDNAFATDNDFLTAVRSAYAITTSEVADWTCFD